ncbi:MAG: hypothetical protein WBG36_03220 [Ornithinimicrobium sp.]
MTRSHLFSGLRERLAARLSKVIGNPVIERKELAAFDIVVGRREVLHCSGLAAVTALIAAGTPPTMWGRHDPELAAAPSEVGLSQAEQASVTAAVALSVGSETFQDTVYAQQVVSAEAVNTHAVVEGARGQLRLQSDLGSDDPEESQFLDTDYHFGPPELVQLEQVDGGWELAHYYHPFGARTDGARTDGLERYAVIPVGTLVSPTKVFTITGTYTNRYVPGSGAQTSQIAYATFVEDQGADITGGIVCIGTGSTSLAPPYASVDDYPVVWTAYSTGQFFFNGPLLDSLGNYLACDTYRNTSYVDGGGYDAAQGTEHLVLYFSGQGDDPITTCVLSLIDTGEPGTVSVKVAALPPPQGVQVATPWRVVHIEWDPTNPDGDEANRFDSVTMARSDQDDSGNTQLETQTLFSKNSAVSPKLSLGPSSSTWTVIYASASKGTTVDLNTTWGEKVAAFDFSTISNVCTLFTTHGALNEGFRQQFQVVVANFGSANLAVFVLGPRASASPPDPELSGLYQVSALFPLAMPDVDGVGEITHLSGGVSKFGGFRFVASDEDGNVFLLRQARTTPTGSPYQDPIWGPFDVNGDVRPNWGGSTYDPLPAGTSSASPLNSLRSWVSAFEPFPVTQNLAYNMLLSTLAAFGTTSSAGGASPQLVQGTWLGSTFKAAYALSRFGYDSEHVVVKGSQTGTAGDFAAYTMFCNPLTKVWHQRLIAQQVLPQPPGMNESGDHFQATVTPVNAYGHPVSVTGNPDYAIEVRADVPTQVIDDTHNLYYDVNQYSSFTAAPDPTSGQLVLVVKAETFAQTLYLRPVFTSGLQPSGTDASLLKSVAETTFPWMSVNISAQAQQRMGNPLPPDQAGSTLPDTTTYVSTETLVASNTSTPWDFKGGYSPSSSNFGDLASYMTTSGQNMLSVATQTTGTYADGTPVNPLSSLNLVPAGSLTVGSTTFGYSNGTVTHTASAAAPSVALGGVWSGVSHALHDALHWLQHIEGQAYKDLADGAVAVAIATESITATVSADIMKQVNGIEQALEQVVSTIEEYANIVVNVLVTIVEDRFLYQLIELIIALISMFIYLDDILKLSSDLHTRFLDILQGTNGYAIPDTTGWSTYDLATTYLGSASQTGTDLGSVDTSSVPNSIEQGILDLVQGNPLTTKLLGKVISEVSKVLDDAGATLPLSFRMGETAGFTAFANSLAALAEGMVTGVADLTADVATDLIQGLSEDVEQPQDAFQNMIDELATLTEQFAATALEPMCDFIDDQVNEAPQVALDMIAQSGYLTLKIPGLADLFKLFGIGDVSGNDLKLPAKDAVFFPMAVIIWVTAYMQDGTKLKGISGLEDDTSDTETGTLGAASPTEIWEIASLVVDAVTGMLGGFAWAVTVDSSDDTNGDLITAVGTWLNAISWADDTVYAISAPEAFSEANAFDTVNTIVRMLTASFDVYLTMPDQETARNPGAGWDELAPRLTDLTELVNAVSSLLFLIYDTYETSKDDANEWGVTAAVGNDIYDMQVVAQFLYSLLGLEDSGAIEYFGPFVAIAPAALMLPILAAGKNAGKNAGDSGDPEEPDDPDPTKPKKAKKPKKPQKPKKPSDPTTPGNPCAPSPPGAPTDPSALPTPGGPDGQGGDYPPANPAEGVPGRVTYTG